MEIIQAICHFSASQDAPLPATTLPLQEPVMPHNDYENDDGVPSMPTTKAAMEEHEGVCSMDLYPTQTQAQDAQDRDFSE